MKIFLDTADFDAIRDRYKTGLVDGITTNPTLVRKSGVDYLDFIKRLSDEFHFESISAEVDGTVAEQMLENANQFSANLTGILSGRDEIEEVRFSSLNTHWAPSGNVHQYLTTDSRTRDMSGNFSDWLSLIAHRWNGKKGPYSPMLFAGVSETEKIDSDGFKIYKYTSPIL